MNGNSIVLTRHRIQAWWKYIVKLLLYNTPESFSEVLGYKFRHSNTADSYPKYNNIAQFLTPLYALQRSQSIYGMKKWIYKYLEDTTELKTSSDEEQAFII